MKKLLVVILLLSNIPAKSQDWDFGFDFFGKEKIEVNLSTLQNPTYRWTDTTQPLSAYQDGYIELNGKGSVLFLGYNPFMNLRFPIVDSLRIEFWVALASTPKTGSYLLSGYDPVNGGSVGISYHNTAANEFEIYKPEMPGGGKLLGAVLPGDTSWHHFKIIWTKSDSTLKSWLDGELKYTHTGVTFNALGMPANYAFCIGNRIELAAASSYNETYTSTVPTTTFRGKLQRFIWAKNDTILDWSFNQNNTQNFFPIRKIGGVIQYPLYPIERVDRRSAADSTSPGSLVFMNGTVHGIDTMDAIVYRSMPYKPYYRDYFEEMSSISSFNGQVWGEGFGGEIFDYNGTLYAFGNFNAGNGFTAFRTDHDSLKGTAKWNPGTEQWEQLGYGLLSVTGTSATMYGFGHKGTLIACGYDVTAVGVGTINYVAQYDTATNLWSAMESGFNNVTFCGASAYGNAFVGGFFTEANSRPVRRLAMWNEVSSKWDSLKGGVDGTPIEIYPDSSSGERLLIIGGYFDSSKTAGVSLGSKGIVAWSVDSSKYKKWNNLTTTTNAVYNILYYKGWYYFCGDFAGITDGITTTTSYGIARWKQGIGLQNVGTGVTNGITGATTVTTIIIHNDILYLTGTFSRFNNWWSYNFAAVNLLNAQLIDVGYGVDMRVEGMWDYFEDIILLGDNFHSNGKPNWIVSRYNPDFDYSDNTPFIVNYPVLVDTAEASFPLDIETTIYKANNLSIDSAYINWKIGINGNETISQLTFTANNKFTSSINPDTSQTEFGDTLFYSINITDFNGNDTIISNSIIILENPTDYLDNLVIWWRADTLVTTSSGKVTEWRNIKDTLTARQSTDANRPSLVSNFLNGLPVIESNSKLLTYTAKVFTAWTVVIVYKPTVFTDGNGDVILGDYVFAGLRSGGSGYGINNGSQQRSVAYNAADTVWGIRVFQSLKLFKNGVEASSYNVSQTVGNLTVSTIGMSTVGGLPFDGYIAEIRVYSENVSASNLGLINLGCNTRWDIY